MWKVHKSCFYYSRKLHIYTGLLLLWFIWLFSISGLLLNHGKWKFADFWGTRKQSIQFVPVRIPRDYSTNMLINNIMDQLNISGEVNEVMITNDSIDFKVSIPGLEKKLHVDLKKGICRLNVTSFNLWGKIRTLHTFNGVDNNNSEKQPSWIMTRIWRFSMDSLAVGLILLCISSWIMWFRSGKYFRIGIIILAAGFVTAIFLVFLVKL